jgi:hypothetical protein
MVTRLKGKDRKFQGKTEISGELGSRDSNPDSMIQSHVSFRFLFNNNYDKVKVFWILQKKVLIQSSQFLILVLSVETRHIGGAISYGEIPSLPCNQP